MRIFISVRDLPFFNLRTRRIPVPQNFFIIPGVGQVQKSYNYKTFCIEYKACRTHKSRIICCVMVWNTHLPLSVTHAQIWKYAWILLFSRSYCYLEIEWDERMYAWCLSWNFSLLSECSLLKFVWSLRAVFVHSDLSRFTALEWCLPFFLMNITVTLMMTVVYHKSALMIKISPFDTRIKDAFQYVWIYEKFVIRTSETARMLGAEGLRHRSHKSKFALKVFVLLSV